MNQFANESESTFAPPALDYLLQIKDVHKVYAARDGSPVRAIDNVSCDVRKGEFISILGPSGCGKSTLLMIVAGLTKASGGEIKKAGSGDPRLPDFGIVFQDAVLFPWRTVQENVELPGEIVGLQKADRDARAVQLLAMVSLSGFEKKFPGELSGGMRQRVAIARSLMLHPSLLLMDEPFGALDAMTREQMNLEVQRIAMETAATVLFVTHSIAESVFLSDRVFVMSGRPSTVKEIVNIDLPRPRTLEMMATEQFGKHVIRLRHLLNAVGDPS